MEIGSLLDARLRSQKCSFKLCLGIRDELMHGIPYQRATKLRGSSTVSWRRGVYMSNYQKALEQALSYLLSTMSNQ